VGLFALQGLNRTIIGLKAEIMASLIDLVNSLNRTIIEENITQFMRQDISLTENKLHKLAVIIYMKLR
jgi:hypothetical protein